MAPHGRGIGTGQQAPATEFVQPRRHHIVEVARAAGPTVWLIGVSTALSSVVAGAIEPLFQRFFFNSVATGQRSRFIPLALFALTFYSTVRVIAYAAALASQRLTRRLARDLTERMMAGYYRHAYADVATHEQGYFVSRIYDEPSRFAIESVEALIGILGGFVTLTCAVAVALWIAWKVTLVLVVVAPTLIYLGRRFAKPVARSTQESSENEGRLRAVLGRAVESYRTVTSLELQEAAFRNTKGALEAALSASYRVAEYTARYRLMSRLFLAYAELAVLLGIGLAVISGSVTIGALVGLMTAYWRVVGSFDTISTQLPVLTRLRTQFGRLLAFEHPHLAPQRSASAASLVATNVRYQFQDALILRDLNLEVRAGSKILISGANGSGKTTLAYILAGLLAPHGGTVALPRGSSTRALLLPFLFAPGTVVDNLSSPRRTQYDLNDCRRLLDRVGFGATFDRDPAHLSQGEQRKLQLVMTLTCDGDYVILDEPLSHLDLRSKSLVMKLIGDLCRGRALVMISHDPPPDEHFFDMHLRIMDGRLVTHDSTAATSSLALQMP